MARMRRIGAACALALAAAVTMNASAAQAAFGDRTLHVGQRGGDVRVLQSLLTRLGHPTAVDGVFGRGTRRGVRRYERADRRGQEPLRPVAAMLALSIAGTCC